MRTTHPYLVRLTHWIAAITIFVLILSSLDIFRTFPSFGSKFAGKRWPANPGETGLGRMVERRVAVTVGPPHFFQAWRWPNSCK